MALVAAGDFAAEPLRPRGPCGGVDASDLEADSELDTSSELKVEPALVAADLGPRAVRERSAFEHCPLLLAALVVYTLASWLQERVSKAQEFNGPLLVLGETGGYVVLGLAWAYWEKGAEGVRSCTQPQRYLLFLPASIAYFTNNLVQYPSLKVFGVVNHSLLCQLNLVVMAVMLYCWKGRKLRVVQWAALLHLSLALVLLVVVASATSGAPTPSSEPLPARDFVTALLAMATCIAASAFASVYLEATLKANAQDAIFVQMHQMNLVQAVVALVLFVRGLLYSQGGAPTGISALTATFVSLNITRGCTISFVLRCAGSLANGAVWLAAIVCVAVLQRVFEGRRMPGMGLQITILLSVANYLFSEGPTRPRLHPDRGSRLAMALQACLFGSLIFFVPHVLESLTEGVTAFFKQLSS